VSETLSFVFWRKIVKSSLFPHGKRAMPTPRTHESTTDHGFKNTRPSASLILFAAERSALLKKAFRKMNPNTP